MRRALLNHLPAAHSRLMLPDPPCAVGAGSEESRDELHPFDLIDRGGGK